MTITDAAELRTALVDQLRGIPALVSLLRDEPSNIVEYVEALNGNLTNVVRELRPPKLLVYLEGIAPTRFPSRFAVSLGIAIRSDEPTGIFAAMLAGVSEATGADGQPLLNSTVHASFDPMALPALERRYIPIDQTAVFDYWEMRLSFTDKTS